MTKYANNPIESDHSRLKSRLRPMRGLKQLRRARVISAGHAFIQNIRRGHYELGTEEGAHLRADCLHRADPGDLTNRDQRSRLPRLRTTQQTRLVSYSASGRGPVVEDALPLLLDRAASHNRARPSREEELTAARATWKRRSAVLEPQLSI